MGDVKNLRLQWKDGQLFYDNLPLGAQDELDAARVLLARNLATRSDTFTTYRGDMPCLTGRIGWAADRRVTTHKDGYPIFKRQRGGSSPPSSNLEAS